MSDLLSKFPPLQWMPAMTEVFVVTLRKGDQTAILGTTNKGDPESKNEILAKGARLVLHKGRSSLPDAVVYYTDEDADSLFRDELDEYLTAGWTVYREPVVVRMPSEPWGDGRHIRAWAREVFDRAEIEVFGTSRDGFSDKELSALKAGWGDE